MDKYREEIYILENEELKLPSSDVNLYIKLLACYLVQNKLSDAKFLWSRIPQTMKTENIKLRALSELLRSILSYNFGQVFKTIDETKWDDETEDIMEDLKVCTMKNILKLVGSTYTSIFDETLAKITNLHGYQLEQKCLELDWNLETDTKQSVVHPKKRSFEANIDANSEYQLSKLTEFVSFLEN